MKVSERRAGGVWREKEKKNWIVKGGGALGREWDVIFGGGKGGMKCAKTDTQV